MSERYTTLYSLPEDLYEEGAPVIVSAGNLLKDNQTGRVLVQLKIRSISAKRLKAATVLIHPQDAAGRPMEGSTQQKYLDLNAAAGEEFGQKTAVYLPDASTRVFSLSVTQVVFSDSSTWEGTSAAWGPLPVPESLVNRLGDAELVRQYQLQFGGSCEAAPTSYKDLWLCACGAWNRDGACWRCGKEKTAQLALDLDALTAEKDARLAREQAEREARTAAAEAKAKKTKKALTIIASTLLVCAAAMLLVTKLLIPASGYSKAMGLFSAGQYEEAAAAFEALGDFRDSRDQVLNVRYAAAEAIFEAGQYEKAAAAFDALGDYRDSRDRAPDARYAAAGVLFEAGRYEEAIAAFEALNGYKDSASVIQRANAEIENAARYADALSLMEDGSLESYRKAKKLFDALADYRDSDQLAAQCQSMLDDKDFQNYSRAADCMERGIYREAVKYYEKCGGYSDAEEKIQECLGALFSAAVEQMKENEYKTAFSSFQYCVSKGYRVSDAEKYMEECNDKYIASPRALTQKGWVTNDPTFTITGVTALYQAGKVTFTVDYVASKSGTWYLWVFYADGGGSRMFDSFSKGESSFSFTVSVDEELSYSSSWSGKIEEWHVYLTGDEKAGDANWDNYWDGWILGSRVMFETINTDLYGNKY